MDETQSNDTKTIPDMTELPSTYAFVEREIAGRTLRMETGQVARQATGSVVCRFGQTQVLAAVVSGGGRDDLDFFPLTCDYREKTESAGKIPGGFFKREGRPTTKEILTMRLIDRSIRPLFPDGFKAETQVQCQVQSFDGENNPDVVAMIAAFSALHVSGMPFYGQMGAVRIGLDDDGLIAFPTEEQRRGGSMLDLVVSGHMDAVCMVEASAKEVDEATMIDALEKAHEVIKEIADMANELAEKAGKPRMEFVAPEPDTELKAKVDAYASDVEAVIFTEGKHARDAALKGVRDKVLEDLTGGIEDEAEKAAKTKAIKNFYHDLMGAVERKAILAGRRTDGRAHDEVRPITIVPSFVPRQHGSVLFTRGETQALVSTTLGTFDDEQIIDGIEKDYRKQFYLHYNFPPFSVGETRRIMGPGRREIGHGMLAERALQAVVPSHDKFPYMIRIVSDITVSNGSSSMASVCGGCMSMMTAGVPLSQPVAGIAMGLVEEGDQVAILTDIQGSEDHNGDMDFKVAGSGIGITALQMDIKIKGVTRDLLERALEQARQARRHVLKAMLAVVERPSREVSEYAPRMETFKIPPEKIGFLIGPGGRNVKQMQADYQVRIAILDDEGNVQVSGADPVKFRACVDAIRAMSEPPEIGSRYTGTVKAVKDFGAFVEILPGVEGLCHISELAEGRVRQVTDVCSPGDELEVEIINVDDRGKIKLSHRAVLVSQD